MPWLIWVILFFSLTLQLYLKSQFFYILTFERFCYMSMHVKSCYIFINVICYIGMHVKFCHIKCIQMITCHKHHAFGEEVRSRAWKFLTLPFPPQPLTSAMSSAEGSLTSLNHVKKVLPFPLRLFRLACCWALLVKSMPSFHLISVELDSGSPIHGNSKAA